MLSTEYLTWVKSSYSGNEGNCVETAVLPDGSRAVRDSKDSSGPILRFTVTEWTTFVTAVTDGEFDA